MWRTDLLEKTLILGKTEAREGGDGGWDGGMASPTRWTWVWVSSGSWWWTGKPGVLQSMGSQRVGHDWAAELNWAPSLPVIIWSVIVDQDRKEFFLYGNLMWKHLVNLDETDNLEPPDHFETPIPVEVAFPPVSEDAHFLLFETLWQPHFGWTSEKGIQSAKPTTSSCYYTHNWNKISKRDRYIILPQRK